MKNILSRLAPAMALWLPVLSPAQSGRAEPADAKASAPALQYRSAFADYRPWQDIKLGNWRDLNNKLTAAPAIAAGHGGHGPEAASAPATPKASAPAGAAQHGHPVHGGKP